METGKVLMVEDNAGIAVRQLASDQRFVPGRGFYLEKHPRQSAATPARPPVRPFAAAPAIPLTAPTHFNQKQNGFYYLNEANASESPDRSFNLLKKT